MVLFEVLKHEPPIISKPPPKGGGRQDMGAVVALGALLVQISQYNFNNSTNGNWGPCPPHCPWINIKKKYTGIINISLPDFKSNLPCNSARHCHILPQLPPIWSICHSTCGHNHHPHHSGQPLAQFQKCKHPPLPNIINSIYCNNLLQI